MPLTHDGVRAAKATPATKAALPAPVRSGGVERAVDRERIGGDDDECQCELGEAHFGEQQSEALEQRHDASFGGKEAVAVAPASITPATGVRVRQRDS